MLLYWKCSSLGLSSLKTILIFLLWCCFWQQSFWFWGLQTGPAWTEMTLAFKVDAQSHWVWEVESVFPVKTCFTHPVNVHITAMQNYIFLPAENQRGHFLGCVRGAGRVGMVHVFLIRKNTCLSKSLVHMKPQWKGQFMSSITFKRT